MTIQPEKSAQYARRASLEDSRWFMGMLISFLADSKETGGRLGLMEFVVRKGDEPPRHLHNREDEAFYVLEGDITFYVGEGTYEATPGAFVFAPRDVPHSFTVETDMTRVLVFVTPGGFEEFSEPRNSASRPARWSCRRHRKVRPT